MRPRRTYDSNVVFSLQGANEDSDLWAERAVDQDGDPVVCTVWVLSDEERREIAEGANIELGVWGTAHPPVGMKTTRVGIGRRPDDG